MSKNDQTKQEWEEKVEVVKKLHDVMLSLIHKKHWKELEGLYNGITIHTSVGSVSFSDPVGVKVWLESNYGSVNQEININAYNAYIESFKRLHLGGKRSTRRHRSRRQRTRRQK